MNLFRSGNFRLRSGKDAWFKIDCDALTDDDWDTLALMVVHQIPTFRSVEGIPTGGTKFAKALEPFCRPFGPVLIVDDVYTTGSSMKQQRGNRTDITGAVVFARGANVPAWIIPLFTIDGGL